MKTILMQYYVMLVASFPRSAYYFHRVGSMFFIVFACVYTLNYRFLQIMQYLFVFFKQAAKHMGFLPSLKTRLLDAFAAGRWPECHSAAPSFLCSRKVFCYTRCQSHVCRGAVAGRCSECPSAAVCAVSSTVFAALRLFVHSAPEDIFSYALPKVWFIPAANAGLRS